MDVYVILYCHTVFKPRPSIIRKVEEKLVPQPIEQTRRMAKLSRPNP